MIKPEIIRHSGCNKELWTLAVPDIWLVKTRFPRLALCWWLLKLAWFPNAAADLRRKENDEDEEKRG